MATLITESIPLIRQMIQLIHSRERSSGAPPKDNGVSFLANSSPLSSLGCRFLRNKRLKSVI